MSIAAQCPKCEARYRVKEDLAGRRFICKVCQAPVVVRAKTVEVGPDLNRLLDDEDASENAETDFDPAQETSSDLELVADTTEEIVLKRTSSFDLDGFSGRSRARCASSRAWIARLEQNPLSLPALVYFLGWVPFSCLEQHFAWVVNIILGVLCLLGAATVKVLELMEIQFSNPLVSLNQLVFGLFTGSSANLSQSGVLKRKKSRSHGDGLAIQLMIILGFLVLHTAVLSLKWYPLW